MTIDQIRSDIYFLTNTSITSYPDANLILNVNRRLDDVVSLILESSGKWKWDDDNQTAQPTTAINMVDQTTAVAIPSSSYLTINRVEVLDVNGNWYKILPFNEREIPYQGMTEFLKTPGRPLMYEKVGGFLNLYPKPSSANVTLSAGLKIYFTRNASYFLVSDTTKVPGFAAPFHRILSLGAALDYCLANTLLLKSEFLTPLLQKMEQDLQLFYASRERDSQLSLKLRRENYGADDSSYNNYNNDKVAFW
jgi:hypothetical protein